MEDKAEFRRKYQGCLYGKLGWEMYDEKMGLEQYGLIGSNEKFGLY